MLTIAYGLPAAIELTVVIPDPALSGAANTEPPPIEVVVELDAVLRFGKACLTLFNSGASLELFNRGAVLTLGGTTATLELAVPGAAVTLVAESATLTLVAANADIVLSKECP